jgi:CRP-like cAMP-binding protein
MNPLFGSDLFGGAGGKLARTVLKTGEHLFREADPVKRLFAVEKGRIKMIRGTVEGREAVMHIALAGESFAEASLFARAYHCDAVAMAPSTVVSLPKEHILTVLHTDPVRMERFVALLSSQVRDLRTLLELRSVVSARERILQYLFLRSGGGCSEITLPSALKDAAAELGLAHETFYRELAALEREGVIARDGRRITLLGTGLV